MSDDDRDNDLESDSTNLKSTRVSSESRETGKNEKGGGRADKRAHHNALERKRRDHIKDSFSSLRETLPCVAGEKSVAVETPKVPPKSRKPRKKTTGKPKKKKESVNVGRTKASSKSKKTKKKKAPSKKEEKEASRAQVLKKAADYIQMMRRKNTAHQHDIEDLRKQNKVLEDQIRNLEKAKGTANYASGMLDPSQYSTKGEAISAFDGGSGSESSDTDGSKDGRRKKLKTSLIDTPLRA